MEPNLFQLHHQNKSNREETSFISQKEIKGTEQMQSWMIDITERFPAPEGWEFLCCNEESPFFMLGKQNEDSKKIDL